MVAAAGRRRNLVSVAGVALVCGDHRKIRRKLLRAGDRSRHARQSRERSGSPWLASRILFSAVLGDVLARRRAGGIGRTGRVEISARTTHAVSACMAITLVARLRSG